MGEGLLGLDHGEGGCVAAVSRVSVHLMIRPILPGSPGPRYRLFLVAHAALLALGEPLVWRYFRRRAVGDPAYGECLEERRGEGMSFEADVWVHAVSLGEMKSAVPMVRLILDAGYRVVTTHATPAGRKAASDAFAREIAAGSLAVRYAPIDRQGYWARFFASTRPKVGLVMEMEFWPGMIEAAAQVRVPLCLANSQVPSKSFPRALWLARLFGHPVARAAAVFAKSGRMADRFRALGVSRVEEVGETRFDLVVPEAHLAAGHALGEALGKRPVLTFASVVAGEETTYIGALRTLLNDKPKPFVIWVPRAPELFAKTLTDLKDGGLTAVSRSEVLDVDLGLKGSLSDVDILVGDSMGEMFFYLSSANAVVVGGGFLESGAHNVIEPMALGKPVVTGPHIWTIEFPAVEAVEAGVLTICETPEALPATLRRAMGQGNAAAKAFHAANSGASERIFAAIRPLLR